MKVKFSIIATATVSWITFAQADEPYVKFNYGRTFSDAQIIDRTDTVEAIADLDLSGGNLFGFAIGTDLNVSPKWGQFAWEGEFGYRTTSINSVQLGGSVPGGFIDTADLDRVETFALMGNVWWRPELFGQIRPYVGGGVGAAYLPSGGLSADDIYSLAYQFGGGVDYEFENGVRAGIGYRYFEISANDRDTSDPLFTFETESTVSENTLYASATVPFAIFDRKFSGRSSGQPLRQRLLGGEKTPEEEFEQARIDAKKKRERLAKAQEKEKKKSEKQARIAAKKRAKAEQEKLAAHEPAEKKSLLRRLNPFSKDKPNAEIASNEIPAKDVVVENTAPAVELRETAVDPFEKISTVSVASTAVALRDEPNGATTVGITNASHSPETNLKSETAARAEALDNVLKSDEFFVQLGAYSSEGFAREMWAAKSTRQPEIFANSNYVVDQSVRRSDNKTLYLLRNGPYDKSSAKAVCALAVGGCFVVSR